MTCKRTKQWRAVLSTAEKCRLSILSVTRYQPNKLEKRKLFLTRSNCNQGSCGSLKVLKKIFFQIFKAWKVLENRHGPWKSLNLCLKVLESTWIWFSETPWPNQLILKKVFQMTSNVHKIHFRPGLRPGPLWGSLWRLYMLIKVPVWFNLILTYPSYGPWKSLNLILTRTMCNSCLPCLVNDVSFHRKAVSVGHPNF